MLLPILRDIVKFTSLGFIDTLRITGTEEETRIESISLKESVVLKAKLATPSPDLIGQFGMGNLNILKGFVEIANFRADGAKVQVKRRERNGEEVPEKISFIDAHGQTLNYRLMAKEIVSEQPKMMPIKWDVSFKPTKSNIENFAKVASILSGVHKEFVPKVQNGNLYFYLGGENTAMHDGVVIFAEGINGKLRSSPHWSISTLLAVLKLADEASDCRMELDSDGLLGITLETNTAEYQYLMAGKVDAME